MKLFSKYNRIIVAVTIFIFLVAGCGFYFTLKYVQLEQVDSDLEIEEQEIKLHIAKYGQLPVMMSVEDQLIQFTPVGSPYPHRRFARTELNDHSGEKEDYRQLIFGVTANGKDYRVTVSKSLEETDSLIQATFAITAITIILMLGSLLVINRLVLKKLWHPFYDTLMAVRNFKVNSSAPIQFPTTNTEEFATMIETLDRSIHQAKVDYLALKTFSENASHEIQTPIAIMGSKIDMLMQDDRLTEEQSKTLTVIASSLNQLSKLNNSLLLLAKIENGQFSTTQDIKLDVKVKEKMGDFNELWQMKGIVADYSLRPATISMNPELVDILLNNLFSNATWHNTTNGKIKIRLEQNSLTIGNTSDEPGLDKRQVFQRFYKSAQTGQRNGLGLSIIRQISEAAHMSVEYGYENGLHLFRLWW